jgi:hypothetical protein
MSSAFTIGWLLTGATVWANESHPHQQTPHIQATGVVTQVTPTAISLKTPFANVTLNVNATERSGFTNVKVGDELTVWMNEDNIVMDVHKKGDQPQHRFITGKLAYSDQAKTKMKLWTPDGMQTFPIKMEEARLHNLKEGTLVTVEIDELGRLMDIHRN